MNKTHLLPQAEQLFIKENKGVTEIAKLLGTADGTISRWAKKRDWYLRREEYQLSSLRLSEKLRKLLADDVKDLKKLDNASIDRILKAVKSIHEIDRQVDMLANTIEVMDHFCNFLQGKGSKVFSGVQEILPDFLVYMREKFKG